ncbi:hypothetical protein HYH03_003473 [Edaphochlamys debaryana]|uniref:Uncharacterized protein n=1 Tax=Edaphochlamys debaryana TaxID=47281 RepID=A0A836C4B8_9CHLO|nr:hypothetical protein HYH03_003473 [Edaphochlamys debaryana]|eukprot:KAG2498733.1 hypothetical protein HYH03_003473 [Edaphochlamys debaryana]
MASPTKRVPSRQSSGVLVTAVSQAAQSERLHGSVDKLDVASELLSKSKVKAAAQVLERAFNEKAEREAIKYGINTVELEQHLRKSVETLGYLREVQSIHEDFRLRSVQPSTVNREFREQSSWWLPREQLPKNWFPGSPSSTAKSLGSKAQGGSRPVSPPHQSPSTPVATARQRPASAALRAQARPGQGQLLEGVASQGEISMALGSAAMTLGREVAAEKAAAAAGGSGGSALRASRRPGSARQPRVSAPGSGGGGGGGSPRNAPPGAGAASAVPGLLFSGTGSVPASRPTSARVRRGASSSGMDLVPGVPVLYDGGGDAAVPGVTQSGPVQLPANQPRYSLNLFQVQMQQVLEAQQAAEAGGGGGNGVDHSGGLSAFGAGPAPDSEEDEEAEEVAAGRRPPESESGGFNNGRRPALGTGYRALADEDPRPNLRAVAASAAAARAAVSAPMPFASGPSASSSIYPTAMLPGPLPGRDYADDPLLMTAVSKAADRVYASNAEARGVTGAAFGMVGATSGFDPTSNSPSTSPKRNRNNSNALAAALYGPAPTPEQLQAETVAAVEALITRKSTAMRASLAGESLPMRHARASLSGLSGFADIVVPPSASSAAADGAGLLATTLESPLLPTASLASGGGALTPTPPPPLDGRASTGPAARGGRAHRSVLHSQPVPPPSGGDTSPRGSGPSSPMLAVRMSLLHGRLGNQRTVSSTGTVEATEQSASSSSPGTGTAGMGALRARLRLALPPGAVAGAEEPTDGGSAGGSAGGAPPPGMSSPSTSFKRALLAPGSPSGSLPDSPSLRESPAASQGNSARALLASASSRNLDAGGGEGGSGSPPDGTPLGPMPPSAPSPLRSMSRTTSSRFNQLRQSTPGGPDNGFHRSSEPGIGNTSDTGSPAPGAGAGGAPGSGGRYSNPGLPTGGGAAGPVPALALPSPGPESASPGAAFSPLQGMPSPFYSPLGQQRISSVQPDPLGDEDDEASDGRGSGGGAGSARRPSAPHSTGGGTVAAAPRQRGALAAAAAAAAVTDAPGSPLVQAAISPVTTGGPSASPQGRGRFRGSMGPDTIPEESEAAHMPGRKQSTIGGGAPSSQSGGTSAAVHSASGGLPGRRGQARPAAHPAVAAAAAALSAGGGVSSAPGSPAIFTRRATVPAVALTQSPTPGGGPGGSAADAMLSTLQAVKDPAPRARRNSTSSSDAALTAGALAAMGGAAIRASLPAPDPHTLMQTAAQLEARGGWDAPVGLRMAYGPGGEVGGQAEVRPWEPPPNSTSPRRPESSRPRKAALSSTGAAAAAAVAAAAVAAVGSGAPGATPMSSRQVPSTSAGPVAAPPGSGGGSPAVATRGGALTATPRPSSARASTSRVSGSIGGVDSSPGSPAPPGYPAAASGARAAAVASVVAAAAVAGRTPRLSAAGGFGADSAPSSPAITSSGAMPEDGPGARMGVGLMPAIKKTPGSPAIKATIDI